MKTNLQRKISWEPAYDKRHADPQKNYGVHGLTMRFLVSGKLGTVQFLLYTNWLLASTRKDFDQFEKVSRFLLDPLPADIGYHSRVPRYEGQNPMFRTKIKRKAPKEIVFDDEVVSLPDFELDREFLPEPCIYLNGDPCFYDGSSLNAVRYFDILVEKGDEALWLALEDYYSRALGIEASWLSKFYIFADETDKNEPVNPIQWFYIYRHQNGAWEKSEMFNSIPSVIWSKIKTHCQVFYKKFNKFTSRKTV